MYISLYIYMFIFIRRLWVVDPPSRYDPPGDFAGGGIL